MTELTGSILYFLFPMNDVERPMPCFVVLYAIYKLEAMVCHITLAMGRI